MFWLLLRVSVQSKIRYLTTICLSLIYLLFAVYFWCLLVILLVGWLVSFLKTTDCTVINLSSLFLAKLVLGLLDHYNFSPSDFIFGY